MSDYFEELKVKEEKENNFKLDKLKQGLFSMNNPKNMIIPFDLSKMILSDYSADLILLDQPNSVL